MAKQTIYLGATAGDGTGTTLRESGEMINDNFTELYDFGTSATVLSLADLNTAYPDVRIGFQVFCEPALLVYTKTNSGWVSQSITIVV